LNLNRIAVALEIHTPNINPLSTMTQKEDREEDREEDITRELWSRKLKSAEDRAYFWKWTAIWGILFLLFCLAVARGCLPGTGSGRGDLL
jgi:hypothetical protein